jgi:thiamine transport system substrate-binding protein
MRIQRPIGPIAIVIAVGLTLAACGSAASENSSTQPGAPAHVTLLAHDSFVVSDSLKEEFTARTGITLDIVTAGDAGTMVAGAILAAGSPTADVMFGIDNTLASRALAGGVFEPYTASDAAELRPELAADTANGMLTPIDFGDVCVNIDDSYFADKGIAAPTTLDDLAKPEYRDLLVVEDPGTSSPGLAFLLATIARYPDSWQDYWQKLRDNGVSVAGSWTDAYTGQFTAGGGKGDRPLVVSYATSPPAEIVYASDPKPTEPSTSVMTDGCYRQVEYAGVLAGTQNPQAAGAVVDWLLSPEVQADLPLSMFVFPARANTPLPDVFTQFAATVASPLQLEPQQVADGVSGWLADWGTVMGR